MPFDRPMDPDESHRWFERQRDLEHYREVELDRREPLLLCPVCFKPLAAMPDCAACGDEEQAA